MNVSVCVCVRVFCENLICFVAEIKCHRLLIYSLDADGFNIGLS